MSTCVVIGAGPGIGSAVSRRFAAEGYRVLAASRSGGAADLEEVAGVERARVDAGDPEAVAALVRRAATEGDLRAVVYNAALLDPGTPLELEPSQLTAALSVNVVGALAAAQEAARHMEGPTGGSVLITGGGLALHPSAAVTALSVGKAALRNLVGCLEQALAPRGIHVASLLIAGTVTPGGPLDPDVIAGHFWELHEQPADRWETERRLP